MRRAAKVDANQKAIVEALRTAGCFVYHLKQPLDLLVWNFRFGGQWMLVEVKNPKGLNKLTEAQKKFRSTCPGRWFVVRSVEEALELVRSPQ